MPSGYGVDSQNVLTVKVSTFVITDSIFLFSIGVAWMRAAPQPAVGANSRGRADKAMGTGRSAREKVAARRPADKRRDTTVGKHASPCLLREDAARFTRKDPEPESNNIEMKEISK